MGRNRGGYTIVEVMIVIAITGLLFASAVLAFQGEQGRTGFSQTMQDLASNVENLATQISSGNYAGSNNYDCSVDPISGKPAVTAGTGQSNDCVFLGRLLQVTPGQSSATAYAVVGSRDAYSGGDTGQLATTVDTANPQIVPALSSSITLDNGAKFLSSKNSTNQEFDLVGIYDNLQASATDGESSDGNVLLKLYQCSSGCGDTTSINNCLATAVGNCGSLAQLYQQWFLCVQGGNNQKAQLEVDTTATGVNTKLNFDGGC